MRFDNLLCLDGNNAVNHGKDTFLREKSIFYCITISNPQEKLQQINVSTIIDQNARIPYNIYSSTDNNS